MHRKKSELTRVDVHSVKPVCILVLVIMYALLLLYYPLDVC